MKSENCTDYWAVLSEHSPNDPHKFVINLEIFFKKFENLNRNPRNNHVTSILTSQLIVKSYINENNDINMHFTVQEVTAAIKRLGETLLSVLTLSDPGYFRQLTIRGGFKSPPPPPLRSRKLLCQSSPYHICEFYQVFLA